MWSLCVLCALLSPVQGQASGGSNHTDVFSRPGSDVLLPLGYNLTIDKDSKSLCDRFTWRYESFQISRSRSCNLIVYNNTPFSNHKILEDGSLTMSSVTRNNSGKYTVNVQKWEGNVVFRHNYTLHILDPLLEPILQVSCLPDGGSNISCRTNTSTDAWFSIRVNGHLLLNSTLSRTMGNVSEVHVPVASPGPWNITCSVRNQVSENETMKTGEKCPAIEVFAAGGETVVLPLYTRLQHTDGQICNQYEWFFMGRYERYQKKLGGVDDHCRRQEWNNKTRPHCSLSSNGSLQLDGVRAHDAGRYTVTTYHLTRAQNTQDIFILHVLDAVSQPVVHLSCLSDHQPLVSCWAANGTDTSTSITANGELLRENTGAEGEKNLYKVSSSAPWNISCSVTNKVSQKTINVLYNMCPVPLSESHLETFCQPDGSANISCKIENGSEPSFSWSVDGNPVQSTSSWKVMGHVMSGGASIAVNISCSVRNAISSVHSPVTTVFCSARAQTFHVFRKILLYFQYNVLLISLIRDIIIFKMNKP